MIDVRELRVANLITWGGHGLCKITEIKVSGKVGLDVLHKQHGYDKILWPSDDIDPIPLTPDWLERCGFVQSEHGNIILWLSNKSKLVFFKGAIQLESVDNPMGAFLDHIRTVHQLQNLYQSLTGTELEIKLP